MYGPNSLPVMPSAPLPGNKKDPPPPPPPRPARTHTRSSSLDLNKFSMWNYHFKITISFHKLLLCLSYSSTVVPPTEANICSLNDKCFIQHCLLSSFYYSSFHEASQAQMSIYFSVILKSCVEIVKLIVSLTRGFWVTVLTVLVTSNALLSCICLRNQHKLSATV